MPFCALALALVGAMASGTSARALALADVPPAVQRTITDNLAGRSVSTIERKVEGGEVSYEVATTAKEGEEWDLTVDEEGTLESKDVSLADVPAAVQTAVTTQVGEGQLEGMAEEFEEGKTTYKAGILSAAGDERDYTYAEDGTLASEETNLTELPPEVQAVVRAQVGQGKLEGIDKMLENGTTIYEGTVTIPSGEERNFTVSESGKLLSEEVRLAELAPEIQAGIVKEAGTRKIGGIDANFDNGMSTYEATVKEADGEERNFTISAKGNVVSREVKLEELSPELQTAIMNEVGQGKLEGIDQAFFKWNRIYEGTMTTGDGQERNFTVSAQGELMSQEVTLEEVPASVQSTISKTVGDGKIIEIDEVHALAKGTVHYTIEAEKGGMSVTFNIGPKGKVWGLDEE